MKTKENIPTIAIIVFSHLCNQTIKTKLQMNKMRKNHLTRHLKDEKAAKNLALEIIMQLQNLVLVMLFNLKN